MTPESKVKAAVAATLKARGAWYCYPATGGYGRSGVPDILACYRSWFIGIECKAEGNKPTTLQERELLAIQQAGGYALVVTGVEDAVRVKTLLDAIDQLAKKESR